jgi:protein-disulfide isomerase
MDKRFLGILAGLAIIFVGIFIVSQKSSDNSSNNAGNNSQITNHVEGQNKKKLTLVEYGDYQCPICGAYYQPLKQALTPDVLQNIQFQFRNLPLTSLHPNAFAAARAAEAAGLQNKYWEMHDKLYENQSSWSDSQSALSLFEGYAKEIGLNAGQFKQDYTSDKVNDAINADKAAFGKTGQQEATPTFFLNGKYVPNSNFSDPRTNAPSAELISKYINTQIAAAASEK